MKISFSGEAYESFQQTLKAMAEYGVDVTTIEGETIEAILHGPDFTDEWGDAVVISRVDEDWFPKGAPFTVRAEEIHVH